MPQRRCTLTGTYAQLNSWHYGTNCWLRKCGIYQNWPSFAVLYQCNFMLHGCFYYARKEFSKPLRHNIIYADAGVFLRDLDTFLQIMKKELQKSKNNSALHTVYGDNSTFYQQFQTWIICIETFPENARKWRFRTPPLPTCDLTNVLSSALIGSSLKILSLPYLEVHARSSVVGHFEKK